MRIVIVGTGAIGGGVAAALARSGQEVVAVARGAQLEAIRTKGLHLRTPSINDVVRFDTVASVSEIEFRPDDMILLAMKGQHTEGALEELRAAGVMDQPIFCLQNGVANERKALRYFPNVHGITVMMPATFVNPGEVVVQSQPRIGLFYIGRFPQGSDAADAALAEALTKADIAGFVKSDVMETKYGKLIMNLSNILSAALGEAATDDLRTRLKDEAVAVLEAAGIGWEDVGLDHPDRKAHMNWTQVPGFKGVGTSTAQSLARGTGSVETDWLNGEIAYLARLHGVPAPVNTYFAGLGARMAREGMAVASVPLAEVEAGIGKMGEANGG